MIPIPRLLYGGRRALQLEVRLGRHIIIIWGPCQPEGVRVARTLTIQSQLAARIEQVEKRESPKPRLHKLFRLLRVLFSKVLGD